MIRILETSIVVVMLLCGTPAAGEDLTADDYVQFWKPLVGAWITTSDRFGETSTGTLEFTIAPNRACILLNHEGEGVPSTQQLQGYDPVRKRLVAFGFADDGSFQIQTIAVDSMRKGKKAAKGVGGAWELKRFTTDGEATTTTSKWEFKQVDRDTVVMVWSDVIEDGKPVDGTHKIVFERQK